MGRHGGPQGFQNAAQWFPCTSESSCKRQLGPAWVWYNEEEELWNYDMNVCGTGLWDDCGHFSTLMSPHVKSIGCGFSFSAFCGGANYVWCNYNGAESYPNIPAPLLE